MPNWLRDLTAVGFLALIAAGIYLLAGAGWALIVAGTEGLAALTVDAWLPLVMSRHGRRHGTDTRTPDS